EVTNELNVGAQGDGTLNIIEGAMARVHRAFVGRSTGRVGLVNVDGADSTWSITESLTVGRESDGALSITNGGKVNGGSCIIALGRKGTVSVDGAGSEWDLNTLTIGNIGTGILNITNGGQ